MATQFHQVNNNAASVLAAAISDSALSAAVTSGDGAEFDSSRQYLTLGRTASFRGEIVDVTSRSTNTFTIATRGVDGTSAVSHDAGDAVECLLVAAHITEIQDAINAIENGTVTLAQVKLGDDTGKLIFGNDSDIQFVYDEATDDRLEITDGLNVLAYLKDLGTTGLFGVTGRIEAPQIGISADDDLLQLAANALTVNGAVTIIRAALSPLSVRRPATSLNTIEFAAHNSAAAYKQYGLAGVVPENSTAGSEAGRFEVYLAKFGTDASSRGAAFRVTSQGLLELTQGGMTTGSDFMRAGGIVYENHTAVGNVGTGEDDGMSASIGAGTLGTNGDSLHFLMIFDTAANGDNKTIKIKFGATTLWDSGAVAANNQRVWAVGEIVRTGAATQYAIVKITTSGGFTATVVTTSPTETLSGAVTLKSTLESATATDNNARHTLMKVWWDSVNS